jgi:hypothetical protein
VACTNEHLSHVLNRILEAPGITRIITVLALATQIFYRVLPLVAAVATNGGTPLGPGEPGPPPTPPVSRQFIHARRS